MLGCLHSYLVTDHLLELQEFDVVHALCELSSIHFLEDI